MKRWSLSQRLFVRVKVLDASISHLPFTGHLSDLCLLPAYVSHRATLSIAVIVWAPASCSKTSAVRVPSFAIGRTRRRQPAIKAASYTIVAAARSANAVPTAL